MARDQGADRGLSERDSSRSPASIALIAAVARNGVIGRDNQLIWKVSSDLKRFRALTWGKPLLMGRKTFEAIGRPLPGRQTIVLTRRADFALPGVHFAHDLESGLSLASAIAEKSGAREIFVAGGAEIYAQTIGRADRLFLTEIELAPAGDAYFPTIDATYWRELKRERGVRTDRDEAEFSFVDYVRREP